MKKMGKTLLLLVISLMMLIPGNVQAKNETFDKAVWVSYLDFQKYLKDKNEEDFTAAFEEVCQNALKYKLDTLIVHVRAFMDAVYPSSVFPTADWISTDQKKLDYDALEIMVDTAHEYGLKFEAWVNPYRVSLTSDQSARFTDSRLVKKLKRNDYISYMSGNANRIILNPASENARDFIVEGIQEIVRNYDVDGIHFDDYFYQTGTLGTTTPEERKENVNQLIKEVYRAIKRIDPTVTFGISPMGNLDNARYEGADLDRWLSVEGYVDYLMPQIYWTNQWGSDGSTTMFSDRLNAFNQLWTNKNIELKVGLGLYMKERQPAGDVGWQRTDTNLQEQVQLARAVGASGFSLFTYADLLKDCTQLELQHLSNLFETEQGPDLPEEPLEPEQPENPEAPETIKNWWIEENGIWIFYQNNEPQEYRWVASNATDWYFAGVDGKLVTSNWIARDANLDVWYYVDENGLMLRDTVIDGYPINAYGEWHSN